MNENVNVVLPGKQKFVENEDTENNENSYNQSTSKSVRDMKLVAYDDSENQRNEYKVDNSEVKESGMQVKKDESIIMSEVIGTQSIEEEKIEQSKVQSIRQDGLKVINKFNFINASFNQVNRKSKQNMVSSDKKVRKRKRSHKNNVDELNELQICDEKDNIIKRNLMESDEGMEVLYSAKYDKSIEKCTVRLVGKDNNIVLNESDIIGEMKERWENEVLTNGSKDNNTSEVQCNSKESSVSIENNKVQSTEILVENKNNNLNEENIQCKKSLNMKNKLDLQKKNIEITGEKFNIVDVRPDGNCLFRCFSKFLNSKTNNLEGSENKQLDIRKKIVKYVVRNWENFADKDNYKNVEEYEKYMGRSATYGIDSEIAIFSKLYSVIVELCTVKSEATSLKKTEILESDLIDGFIFECYESEVREEKK
ncbi:homeobox protein 9-like [Leptopilina boulardi]|uniref:homeobox protein 9-like n=1 Tax=Leptopilina boulardi TaxID=63433 RepID=UPI0021F688B4|nr:homeobox protein 9-like [Leptopilina boulardi]